MNLSRAVFYEEFESCSGQIKKKKKRLGSQMRHQCRNAKCSSSLSAKRHDCSVKGRGTCDTKKNQTFEKIANMIMFV